MFGSVVRVFGLRLHQLCESDETGERTALVMGRRVRAVPDGLRPSFTGAQTPFAETLRKTALFPRNLTSEESRDSHHDDA
jgi:hypothetical protein